MKKKRNKEKIDTQIEGKMDVKRWIVDRDQPSPEAMHTLIVWIFRWTPLTLPIS
jgi:hypothetical protein